MRGSKSFRPMATTLSLFSQFVKSENYGCSTRGAINKQAELCTDLSHTYVHLHIYIGKQAKQ